MYLHFFHPVQRFVKSGPETVWEHSAPAAETTVLVTATTNAGAAHNVIHRLSSIPPQQQVHRTKNFTIG
jgi:hypothetical protein